MADYSVIEDEIQTDESVSFTNYTGINKLVNTLDEIYGIGYYLADEMKAINGIGTAGQDKYQVMRVLADASNEGYFADIFIIGSGAHVDHIRNLRRIIAGYLERSFNYSHEGAKAVATYITIYNARHRGDMVYFASRYHAKVMEQVQAENLGLAAHYQNWPGNTRILIPINGDILHGQRIGDAELDSAADDANLTEQDAYVAAAEEQVKRDRAALNEKKKELEERRTQTTNEQEKAALDKEEEELAQREDELDKRQNEVESMRDDVDKQRDAEGTTRREQEEERLREELVEENVYKGKVYFLMTLGWRPEAHYINEIYVVNPVNNTLEEVSEVDNITGINYSFIDNYIAVITYESKAQQVHHLSYVNLDTLKLEKSTKEDVFWRSPIKVYYEEIYVFIRDGENYYLARYDKDLNLLKVSRESIERDSKITFYRDYIYVTGPKGETRRSIMVFDRESLRLVKEILP